VPDLELYPQGSSKQTQTRLSYRLKPMRTWWIKYTGVLALQIFVTPFGNMHYCLKNSGSGAALIIPTGVDSPYSSDVHCLAVNPGRKDPLTYCSEAGLNCGSYTIDG